MSEWLRPFPIVPVIVCDRPDIAADLAHALHDGGVDCAEITLRTPRALEVLAAMIANAPPGFVVGAGTVLEVAQVGRVADAGAAFIVSPGFDPDVVDRARTRGLDVLPGVASATEVQRARREGVRAVKLFPADLLGGRAAIDALSAVFADTGFVPSGGVGPHNAADYLAHPAVPSVSGSWLAPRAEIEAGDLSRVAERARAAMQLRAAT
ncbi:bifunctional 4-hydroxy-2-oxoglutarate aldolase/2-dehydro-3-deoxy-phosphogluconate aldolase [Microbacterium sp. 5K110]|jgi:2-dehydro-3-deoxyphosphogluconate aldolase/(4S)-4-hydroxy-2-oxoglutarate aldolase|uniref:bifunctional 4-hydroxy-2-oxoglutarate aldolase/2-dehydro-3-deoxy-phosphogluconate aldolase n=1 Tax=unclassified Microbacterium TaxID=2609290 RepID=UPI0010FCE734|nr:bifunctional 4-hydroxy-2-oxoglutarate aldolase/2-dehydro-3-deoxy-phosphogluconate aldolase [Microbacterium sp. 5K110]TLF29522.1 bifunctional 4-hydroxy-2-oxoglutarate aldolase/2-dehydro-3-deoxy-phosphogluconate aldolase [Microbacterium sp. 5K110]